VKRTLVAAAVIGAFVLAALPTAAGAATKQQCPKQPTRNVQYRKVKGPLHLLVRRGTLPRQRQLEAYADVLTAAGVPVTIVDARGLSHNEVNAQIGAPGDTVMTQAVTSFLATCFAST